LADDLIKQSRKNNASAKKNQATRTQPGRKNKGKKQSGSMDVETSAKVATTVGAGKAKRAALTAQVRVS
jgi:hypothetical protein